MSVPFDYVNGEKVDLSKQSHRDEVIKRNKNLEKLMSERLDLSFITQEVNVNFNCECPKCGSKIEYETDIEICWSNGHIDLDNHIGTIECGSCNFRYSKILSHHENVWVGRVKEEKQKAIKL